MDNKEKNIIQLIIDFILKLLAIFKNSSDTVDTIAGIVIPEEEVIEY